MPIGLLTGLLALLVAPIHQQSPALRPLQVDANGWTYVDNNAPVRLVGVNVDTYIFEDGRIPPPWFVTDRDFANIAAWGANSFRLNMDYRWFVTPDLKAVNQKGWEYLDWAVAEAEAHHLYAILDMHIPVGGMQVGGKVTSLWSDGNKQRVFIELWQQIAQRYKNSPAIAGYYLIGEPTPRRAKQWQQLAQQTLDAIRQISNQVVVVEAPSSGDGDLKQLKPLTGPNVMYAWQFYEPFAFTHQGASWEDPGSEQTADVHYPGIIVDEYKELRTDIIGANGTPAQGADRWIRLASNPLTPPEGATHVSLRLFAEGGKGKVFFDDVQILEDGQPMELLNPGFEDGQLASERRDRLPDFWHSQGARGAVQWLATDASRSGKRCIRIDDAAPTAYLRQAADGEAGRYVVKPGSSYVFSVWCQGARVTDDGGPANIGIEVRWDSAETTDWGPQQLDQALYDNTVAWARQNQVPVYVPEFAASAAAPNRDDLKWTRDTLAALDKYKLSWQLWDFRDIHNPEEAIQHVMGLYEGPDGADSAHCKLDTALLDVLKPAFQRAN